jgi:hypothetical protein
VMHKATTQNTAAVELHMMTATRVLVVAEVRQPGRLEMRLVLPPGRPLDPFYRWPRLLGWPRPSPQVWTSSGRFATKEDY